MVTSSRIHYVAQHNGGHNETRRPKLNITELEMWISAQRGGRPAEYRWRPLFNAAKFG